MKTEQTQYCCKRFEESVTEGIIVHAENQSDETEWFIPEWLHIYYCPFCGEWVKGRGWGRGKRKKPVSDSRF